MSVFAQGKLRHSCMEGYDPELGHVFPTPDHDVDELHPANLIMSEKENGKHMLFLDLDVEHEYRPSSTDGHGHLAVNLDLEPDAMFLLMDILAAGGVIEVGYAKASRQRGYAGLRLPGVAKGDMKTCVEHQEKELAEFQALLEAGEVPF